MNQLETNRLILRPFISDDAADLYEYLSDKTVLKYEPCEIFTFDACKAEAISRSQNKAFWAVCLKDTGKLIGNIYFSRIDPLDLLTYEIGYVFNATYQKQGFAAEAATAILNYAFNALHARRVIAMCNPKNVNSWRLLERLHMRREGHLIQNIYFNKDEEGHPIWQDTYEYGILAQEWLSHF